MLSVITLGLAVLQWYLSLVCKEYFVRLDSIEDKTYNSLTGKTGIWPCGETICKLFRHHSLSFKFFCFQHQADNNGQSIFQASMV
jgi:hypothetical protein